MARQQTLFCKSNQCYTNRVFEYRFVDHGLFSGNHTDWHCPVCDRCDYDRAR